MNDVHVINLSPSILAMLGVAFVVLKLLGYINWSWWLVTLPFWGPVALILVFVLMLSFLWGCACIRGLWKLK